MDLMQQCRFYRWHQSYLNNVVMFMDALEYFIWAMGKENTEQMTLNYYNNDT